MGVYPSFTSTPRALAGPALSFSQADFAFSEFRLALLLADTAAAILPLLTASIFLAFMG